jgi:hypothetical protein
MQLYFRSWRTSRHHADIVNVSRLSKADIRLQRNIGRFGPETDIASVCGRTAKYVTDPGIKAWYCS